MKVDNNGRVNIDLLRRLLIYEPISGKVFWKDCPRYGIKKYTEAGSLRKDGYIKVQIQGRPYKLHRVVWALCYGSWPSKKLDHINRKRSDNRLENLREVTHKQNNHNRSPQKGSSQYKGVGWHKASKKWCARVYSPEGKRVHLGVFNTEEEAAEAYNKAASKFYGIFALLNEVKYVRT